MKKRRYQKYNETLDVCFFNSLSDLVHTATDPANPAKVNKETWQMLVNKEASDFTNSYTLERVKRELKNPPEAKAYIASIAKAIERDVLAPQTRRVLRRNREDGDELDPIAWVNRNPDGWSRIERTRANMLQRVVRIACNVAVNHQKRPEHLYYRGAAAVALADALEQNGYSVEVCMIDGTIKQYKNDPKKRTFVECTVKPPDMPVDIDALSLVLGEIGFFRTAMFALYTSICGKKVKPSLGSESGTPLEMRDRYDIIMDNNITTKAKAIEAVKRYSERFKSERR